VPIPFQPNLVMVNNSEVGSVRGIQVSENLHRCVIYFNDFFGLPFLNENHAVQCFTEDSMETKPFDGEKIDSHSDYILKRLR
jgi:hypothetical protein